MPTPSMEDYLEVIYLILEDKGYARVTDIASSLDVLPSSVTKMLQKLDEKELGIYEKYRGFILTSRGKKIAKDIADKHQTLEDFFRILEIPSKDIYKEVEGIEHHIGKETTFCIATLIQFLEENPEIRKSYLSYRNNISNNK
ncbi:Mn-dependent DtxR family transcriptional regulator [Bacillus mesophilus]|uniref:Manganese transport regulator n=1 Tax=Bacillus mesophilus TaxID=1808955 RepID=A0A6M0QFL4_9BACI|nr:Mn-dependent DtxR family transcriptional regulator [Bacillus mesophilus]NEY74228.1 transcriptional regulator MntR [Bacillus mesophilus]